MDDIFDQDQLKDYLLNNNEIQNFDSTLQELLRIAGDLDSVLPPIQGGFTRKQDLLGHIMTFHILMCIQAGDMDLLKDYANMDGMMGLPGMDSPEQFMAMAEKISPYKEDLLNYRPEVLLDMIEFDNAMFEKYPDLEDQQSAAWHYLDLLAFMGSLLVQLSTRPQEMRRALDDYLYPLANELDEKLLLRQRILAEKNMN